MSQSGAALTLTRMTWRNLARRPMRTALTALGVAIGVVAIVAFTSMVRGLWHSIDAIVHINDADLLVFQSGVAADILSVLDEEEVGEKLRAMPEIKTATGALLHIMPVQDQPFFLVLGVRKEDVADRTKELREGRRPETSNEVMLGFIAAQMLGRSVGDEMTILGKPYTLVGIIETGVVFLDGALVMDLPRLQEIAGKPGVVTAFQVYVKEEFKEKAGFVGDAIEQRDDELAAVTDAAGYNKVDQGLEIADNMVWAISFLAILVGAIIVTNTMWMAVNERTREIGVLRAVGWSRAHIVRMILLESAAVGLLACVVGSVAGVGLAKLATVLKATKQFVHPVFDFAPFTLALVTALALSIVGALLPSWRAARISPAEALRYE